MCRLRPHWDAGYGLQGKISVSCNQYRQSFLLQKFTLQIEKKVTRWEIKVQRGKVRY